MTSNFTSFFLSFACSIHCLLFATLSIILPTLHIKDADWAHQFDFIFIFISSFTSILIFIKFYSMTKKFIIILPFLFLVCGITLLAINFFIYSQYEYSLSLLGSFSLAISNIYYIRAHKKECRTKGCQLHSKSK